MHVRCPHCRNPIEVLDEISSVDILCPSCGSSFNLAPQASTLVLNKQLLDHFELLEELGAGAFGTVWKARDRELDRLVAIKVPRQQQLNADEAEMFLREARSAAQLKHPNIVSVHEVGRAGNTLYIVSDFVAGVTLADWLTVHRPAPREAAELCRKIAAALDHAHEHGVIHRDLKPSNIMLSEAGDRRLEAGGRKEKTGKRGESSSSSLQSPASSLTPHLMDFGLAKREAGEITMTADGRTLGTPAYMSPEQARGEGHHVDRRADIYSLGVVLFELLTGECPFRGNVRMLLHQVIHDEPPSPRKLNGGVPRDLETITLKCLEKEPARRFATAKELEAELGRYLGGEPIQSRPVSRVERAWRWAKRHPARAGAAAASVIALAALAAVLVGAAYQDKLESANENLDAANEELKDSNAELQSAKQQLEAANDGLTQSLNREKVTSGQLSSANASLRKAQDDLERLTYYRLVSLALAEWKDNGTRRAGALLAECRPQLRGWEWHYVDGLCRGDLAGQRHSIRSVGFSPDGKRVQSLGVDGRLIVWDAESSKAVLDMPGRADIRVTTCAALSGDGNQIVAGNIDNSLSVWAVDRGPEAPPLRIPTPLHVPQCVAFSEDGKRIVSGGREGAVKIWDADMGAELHSLSGHKDGVICVAFSAVGRRVVSGGNDALLRIWDPDGGAEAIELRHRARCVAFSPDGEKIASGGGDRSIVLWNALTGENLGTWRGHSRDVSCLAFSRDGTRVVSGDYDRRLKVWDVKSGDELLSLHGHTVTITSVAFSPDGTSIVSGCGDGNVRQWHAASGAEALELRPHQPANDDVCVAFSPDSSRIVCRDSAGFIKVKSAASGRELLALADPPGPVTCVAYSADGKRIAAGCRGNLHVWDAETGAKAGSWPGTKGDVTCLAFSPDGGRIFSAAFDNAIHVWDAASGEHKFARRGHTGTVRRIIFNPSGTGLISFSNDGTARLWDARTSGGAAQVAKGHAGPGACARFGPQGTRIYAADGTDNYMTVSIWQANDGAELMSLRGHLAQVTCVDISPDGRRIVSGDREGVIKVWDTANGIEALTLKGHEAMLTTLRFSPDGKRIVSGSVDGMVKIWSASNEWDSRPRRGDRPARETKENESGDKSPQSKK